MSDMLQALTLDGAILFKGDNHQKMGEAIFSYIEAGTKPALAYTYDGSAVFRYSTWEVVEALPRMLIGTPHKTFAEMLTKLRS